MSLETRIHALATAMGTDVNGLLASIGTLASLSTTAKTSLVASINEVAAAAASATGIDDASTSSSTTWSSTKIAAQITTQITGLAADAPATLDTINELAAALEDNPDVMAALRTLITANADAIAALALAVGDTDADFVATYTAAKTA